MEHRWLLLEAACILLNTLDERLRTRNFIIFKFLIKSCDLRFHGQDLGHHDSIGDFLVEEGGKLLDLGVHDFGGLAHLDIHDEVDLHLV